MTTITDKQIEAALRAWYAIEPGQPLDFVSEAERNAMFADMRAALEAAEKERDS